MQFGEHMKDRGKIRSHLAVGCCGLWSTAMHFIVKPSYICFFHLLKIHTRVEDELVSDNRILSLFHLVAYRNEEEVKNFIQ